MTAKEYLEQLAQTAGLTDDQKAGLLKVAENEKAAKALEEGVMLRSDYSRNLDTLKKEKDEYQKYYKDTLDWRATKQKEIDKFYADLEAGGNNGNGTNNNGNATVFTVEAANKMKEEYDQRLKTQETQFISLLKGVGDITSDYVTRFKEKPDLNAIEKIAVEKQITLTQAYQEYIAPRVQEAQKVTFDAQLKAAREEGAKDALSKHRLPVDTAPREFHPVMDDKTGRDAAMPPAGAAREQWIRSQFISDLNTPANATSGSTT